ncbi:hypothetical protein Ccrd_016126 [Cynara cardunculus var. scolymus]|uniref:Uncharacterized protein n=1 Tax=Cynara cardunculus var. scolymus TaxID=59895 RepID=A0A103YAJ7_CYNCS|nr:hypothetical protein Ccrd_016126 [Cynara cardunculus var. scolymus]
MSHLNVKTGSVSTILRRVDICSDVRVPIYLLNWFQDCGAAKVISRQDVGPRALVTARAPKAKSRIYADGI